MKKHTDTSFHHQQKWCLWLLLCSHNRWTSLFTELVQILYGLRGKVQEHECDQMLCTVQECRCSCGHFTFYFLIGSSCSTSNMTTLLFLAPVTSLPLKEEQTKNIIKWLETNLCMISWIYGKGRLQSLEVYQWLSGSRCFVKCNLWSLRWLQMDEFFKE